MVMQKWHEEELEELRAKYRALQAEHSKTLEELEHVKAERQSVEPSLLDEALSSQDAAELLATWDEECGKELEPGSGPALVEAVRLICGEVTVWLEDSEQWSFPDAADMSHEDLRGAVLHIVYWLDNNAKASELAKAEATS